MNFLDVQIKDRVNNCLVGAQDVTRSIHVLCNQLFQE